MARRRRWFRFSLGFCLLLMTCVAGYLSGRKLGFDAGYTDGYQSVDPGLVFVKSYAVYPLLPPMYGEDNMDYTSLARLLKKRVPAGVWKSPDPAYRMDVDEKTGRIIVSQTKDVHLRLDKLLKELQLENQQFYARIDDGKCGMCGKAELPADGEKCKSCKRTSVARLGRLNQRGGAGGGL